MNAHLIWAIKIIICTFYLLPSLGINEHPMRDKLMNFGRSFKEISWSTRWWCQNNHISNQQKKVGVLGPMGPQAHSIQYPIPNIQRPLSSIQYPVSNCKFLGAKNGHRRTVLVRFGTVSVDFNYNLFFWDLPGLSIGEFPRRVHWFPSPGRPPRTKNRKFHSAPRSAAGVPFWYDLG